MNVNISDNYTIIFVELANTTSVIRRCELF